MTTVLQDVSLEELQRLCPDTWTIIQQKSDAFVSPSSMLKQIGLVEKGTIFALFPDFLGEYFVYTWLLQHPDKVQRFLYSAWQRSAPTAVFFNRIVHDYSYLLNENAKHWEAILPNDIPPSEDTAWLYAMFLVNATYHCSIAEGHERQINLLKELVSGYPMNLHVTVALANGLFNLSTKQDEQGARDTIACLENLAAERPYVPDIAIWLAKSLFNLSTKQNEQSARDTLARLESLAAEYQYVLDIVIVLANNLFNLSTKQDEQGAQDTIARLESLATEHPYVPDIAIWLAKGLFNLSTKQDEQDARDTTARLEGLATEHPDMPEIVIALANGLFNLSIDQDEQSMRDTIVRLENLATEHPDVLDIVIALAKRRKILMGKNSENSGNTQTARYITDVARKPTLFLSYSQKDSSIANIIEDQLKNETNDSIEISRYTRVPYKGSFKAFMNSIQEHDFVLCLVSDNYLKSQACMYEVGEIIKDHHFEEKLLFVVIGENDRKYYSGDIANFAAAKIYGNERNRLKYIQYWKSEYEKLKEEMGKIDDVEALDRSTKELKEIGKIYRNDISEFLTYLAQNNGKNFEELYANHFFDIIKWIFPNWESKVFVNCENMSELLTNAIEEICKATQTDYNQIALSVRISSHETGLVVYADNVNDRKQRYRLVVMEGLMANSFSTGHIINIGNVKNEPQYFIAVEKTESELVVPITFLGNIIGVINSESEKENYYSREIVDRISCISQGFSIALKRIGYVPNMSAIEIPYIHI